MDKLNLRTLRNEVIILQDEIVERNKINLILSTDKGDHKKPNRGTVVAVNDKVCDELPIGTRVFFSRYAGRKMKHNGKDLLIMTVNEVFGTLDGDINIDAGETFDYHELTENLNLDKMKEDFGQD